MHHPRSASTLLPRRFSEDRCTELLPSAAMLSCKSFLGFPQNISFAIFLTSSRD